MAPYVLCAEITPDVVRDCLRWIAANPASPLHIWLCSNGGDIADAMALYAAIKNHAEEVTITVLGCVESCASVVLQAADVRRIDRNAYIMLHRGSTSLTDTSPDESATTAKFLQTYYDYVDKLVYQRMKSSGAKLSAKRYREEISRAKFYSADEALKGGLVDEVI